MAEQDHQEHKQSEKTQLNIGAEDWPAIVTDKVVETVSAVRSRTVDNLALVVRSVVYGPVAAAAFLTLFTLAIITVVRMADIYLPIGESGFSEGLGSATWAAHALTGTLSLILGLGLWKARLSTARPIIIAVVINVVLIVSIIIYALLKYHTDIL